MPTGLDLPHRVTRGRLGTLEGPEQILKLVMIACGPRECENPWNRAGTEVNPFEIDTPEYRARIRVGIGEHFAKLREQRRAELREVKFVSRDDNLEVRVTYFNLAESRVATAVVSVGKAFSGGG